MRKREVQTSEGSEEDEIFEKPLESCFKTLVCLKTSSKEVRLQRWGIKPITYLPTYNITPNTYSHFITLIKFYIKDEYELRRK
jgi:hypothetical protein